MNIQVNINLCRVCMKAETGTSMLSDENLQSKFQFVTHLKVKKGDNLPAIICEKCILLLNLSYKFIQSAQETEKNLKTFLAKINSDFKLVTKNSPVTKGVSDEVNGMLELLGGTEAQHIESSSKIPSEDLSGNIPDKSFDTGKIQKDSKKDEGDVEELLFVEETPLLERLNSDTTDDDETKNTHDKNELARKQVTLYLDLTDENSQAMEYKSLNDMLVTEKENSNLDNNLKEQQSNKEGYFEEYESLLEDDTTTMDILCEDNDNVFQEDDIKNTLDSGVVVETVVVEVESQNANIKKEKNEVTISNEIESNRLVLEEKSTPITQKMLSRVGSMRKLNSSVAESTRFYCAKCNRDFSTKTNLTRHMQLHEGKRPYQCNICHKDFSQNGTLKQHMYIHTGEKPHVCSICNRGFTQSKSLVFHMRRHTGYKPHQCDYCALLFRQKDALKVHILKHHTDVGERTFSCKICNKQMNGQELRNHMKKHLNNHKTITMDTHDVIQVSEDTNLLGKPIFLTDEQPFDVENATHVIDIMATSTTEPSRAKKYQCRACFKCFAIKKNLIRHLSFHEVPAASFQHCQTCDLVFDTNYALKVHRVREHKDININLNECDDCQLKFQNASELGHHMQYSHTFTCTSCPDMLFATKTHLNNHLLEHNIAEIEDDE